MITAVAVGVGGLPEKFVDAHGLGRRVYGRGGEQEVQFHFWDRERVLPVLLDGRLVLMRWGNRKGESRTLPVTGWTRRATVESGYWLGAGPAVVPAWVAYDGGVWYRVRQGVEAVAVEDENGEGRAYLVCEPSSHYYRVMTRSDWMPALIGERI